uniref:AA_permease domain-containing protein n=1 Tax=Globodera pallida TaxID=36090 RepID=A0A183BVX2_GLOPA
MVTSLAKIVANILIVGIAFYFLIFKGSYENLRDPFANSTFAAGNLVNAFFAGFFSYDGWDVLNFGAEEIKDPKRTMPFAILVGMSCVSTIYATINLSYFIVLTVPQIENSPAVDFAQNTIGRLQVVMPFVINLALINAMNGSMFSASRYLFAVARERHLPSFISFASTKHDSPKAALFVHVLLVFIFSFVGNTEQLMEYLGFAQWLQRGFTMCALLYIRFGHLPVHPQSIRVPLLIPILFMFICFSVVIVTLLKAFSSAFVGLIVLGASLFVYFIFVWDKALPRFRCYSAWTSKINDLMARLTQQILDGQIDANEANALYTSHTSASAIGLHNRLLLLRSAIIVPMANSKLPGAAAEDSAGFLVYTAPNRRLIRPPPLKRRDDGTIIKKRMEDGTMLTLNKKRMEEGDETTLRRMDESQFEEEEALNNAMFLVLDR